MEKNCLRLREKWSKSFIIEGEVEIRLFMTEGEVEKFVYD